MSLEQIRKLVGNICNSVRRWGPPGSSRCPVIRRDAVRRQRPQLPRHSRRHLTGATGKINLHGRRRRPKASGQCCNPADPAIQAHPASATVWCCLHAPAPGKTRDSRSSTWHVLAGHADASAISVSPTIIESPPVSHGIT